VKSVGNPTRVLNCKLDRKLNPTTLEMAHRSPNPTTFDGKWHEYHVAIRDLSKLWKSQHFSKTNFVMKT
jgi:hypothetical protein